MKLKDFLKLTARVVACLAAGEFRQFARQSLPVGIPYMQNPQGDFAGYATLPVAALTLGLGK